MLHIKFAKPRDASLIRLACPTCECRTFFAATFEDYYGWHKTCLKCGESWQDGEMLERPFERGWRKRRIEQAKQTYRRLTKEQQK